jgi:predicted nucleotidyltransferase
MPPSPSSSPSPLPFAVPEAVRRTITTTAAELMRSGVVRTVAVYGGVARGRFVQGRSDVNLLIVLERGDGDALQALAPALQQAGELRIEPMFVTAAELHRLAAVFPIKFRDIQQHHVVVAGDATTLTALPVPMTHARLRVEQELRNLALRSRRRFVDLAARPAVLRAHLVGLVRPLAIELSSLLAIDGHPVPDEDRTAAIFAAAASAYRLDGQLLKQLADLRQGQAVAADDEALFVGLLGVLERAATSAGGAS